MFVFRVVDQAGALPFLQPVQPQAKGADPGLAGGVMIVGEPDLRRRGFGPVLFLPAAAQAAAESAQEEEQQPQGAEAQDQGGPPEDHICIQ